MWGGHQEFAGARAPGFPLPPYLDKKFGAFLSVKWHWTPTIYAPACKSNVRLHTEKSPELFVSFSH